MRSPQEINDKYDLYKYVLFTLELPFASPADKSKAEGFFDALKWFLEIED